MQNRFLQLGLAFIIGSALTACSSNAIVQNKAVTPSKAKKHIVVNKKTVAPTPLKKRALINKKRVLINKKKVTVKKAKRAINNARSSNVAVAGKKVYKKRYSPQKPKRRYIAKNNSNYRKYSARKNLTTLKNDAIRKSAHDKYFAIKRESHRKYQALQQRNKYAPRKKAVYRRYAANKKPVYRRYTARKRSSYRRPTVRRITPNFPNASFAKALSTAAVARTRSRVRYDGRYVNISYPWGDVPSNIGVCTDVVIRSYRRLGIDLQKAVHEDMTNGGFYDYPNIRKWNLSSPDKNIDHRRVYNLQAFFRRHGAQLPITHNPTHYKPGDLVTWMVGPNLPHIGVVVEQRSKVDPRRHMIVHNIANGPQMEDILFKFRITGHYRYNRNNRLIAPRRFRTDYAMNNIGNDYKRIMQELSTIPARKTQKNMVKTKKSSKIINVTQLKSDSGISDAEIKALLGK
jgi:uncharacterized protein YijF (DUF1287 family)